MKKRKVNSMNLTLLCTGLIFLLLTLTMMISNGLTIYGFQQGWITPGPPKHGNPFYKQIIQNGYASVIIGTILAFCITRMMLRPINRLIQAIHNVSDGDYQTKIYFKHSREFKELSHSFNQMTDELSSVEMLRSDFVNNFSHEFKTPIVSILGFAKLLKKGNLSAQEQVEYLDIIISESQRLADLSSNVLNLSKIESMSLLSDSGTFHLSEQIRQSVLLLEGKWAAKDISFDFSMEELSFTGNESLLKQVWTNLLDNAIKFAPTGSELQITLIQKEDQVTFSIRDHGPGMSSEVQKHIFDKFYQGDTSHATKGNGLGLALVKKIVELHQGTISVDSTEGSGSTFTVTLPRT